MAARRCIVYRLPGLTPYEKAWRYQRVLSEHIYREKIRAANGISAWPADHLLLVQHPRIFTLGRGATRDNIKFALSTDGRSTSGEPEVLRVERGGEVTWHGPGQLVAYPILDINNDRPGGEGENNANAHKKDLHWYTNKLEETVITLLQNKPYCIPNVGRHAVNTGVWISHSSDSASAVGSQVNERFSKICAMGITASRWITMHGLALNISPDLSDYKLIVPCGIQPEQIREDTGRNRNMQFGVCSMQELLPSNFNGLEFDTVRANFEASFSEVFRIQLEYPRVGAEESLDELLQMYPSIRDQTLPRHL
jgi:lipoyl(octanoyl) transferase